MLASGAKPWMMPAHAVPWPNVSSWGRWYHHHVPGLVDGDDDTSVDVHSPLEVRMGGVDPAVDHGHPHTFTARASPGPLRREILQR